MQIEPAPLIARATSRVICRLSDCAALALACPQMTSTESEQTAGLGLPNAEVWHVK